MGWKFLLRLTVLQPLICFNLFPSAQSLSAARRSAQRVSPNSRLVFAHFITGLTANYTASDWSSECELAASHGIDAFVLNVGLPEDWQLQQVGNAYEAANVVNTTFGKPFKVFLSLDMSVIQSAEDVTTWVTTFVPLPAQLLINGRPLVSTFSGEANNLGASDLSSGWEAAVKEPLAAADPPLDVLFIPVWSNLDPDSAVSNHAVVDGIMTWNPWPRGLNSTNMANDIKFQRNAKASKKLYMAAVSPCFFTHYSEKNWIYRSDDNLYISRWKELIAMPSPPDFIQILSWNDLGESHYIGPQLGIPPRNTTWLNGFDHQSWLKMSEYFIEWYKTGSPPLIQEDTVYFNYRPHSINAVATSETLPPPTNASLSVDAIYASTFLTSSSPAAQLRVTIGNNSQFFSHLNKSKISTFTAPWNGYSGNVQVALLDKTGKELMMANGPVPIDNEIETYNFNYATKMINNETSEEIEC